MTVLSSRDHTCVNPTVYGARGGGSKNELCRELVNEGRCEYFLRTKRGCSDSTLKLRRHYGLKPAWDIEDLVRALTKRKDTSACAYYTARGLMEEADIIFCPYNYLIDANIRKSMNINVKDHIVILDEAHNIEDACREAASVSITEEQLVHAQKNLEAACRDAELSSHAAPLLDTVEKLLQLIQTSASKLRATGFNQLEHVWDSQEMLGLFHYVGVQLTEGTHLVLSTHLSAIMTILETRDAERRANGEDNNESVGWQPIRRRRAAAAAPEATGQPAGVDSVTLMALEAFLLVCHFFTREGCKYANDYRVALQKVKSVLNPQFRSSGSHGPWLTKPQTPQSDQQTLSLSFWCLNPAVAFTELGSVARCVILTSGTLSPMASFQSELGQPFPLQLEANHVIKPEQVLVCSVARGPTGRSLCANYQNSERFDFQDELGALLASVCDTVPHGVLCFMPSYTFLEKMRSRWATTGLLERLERRKVVVTEPRGSSAEFEEAMRRYVECIEIAKGQANQDSPDGITGGLLLAVCRGKMSEGIDFSDEQCRACITVGIPFPSVKDTLVGLKRRYNDQHAKERSLLDGGQWYETQAFRALNQALGRCIRHRHDWGALLLVDERFTQKSGRYLTGLSKWVRGKVTSSDDYEDVESRLAQFVAARTAASARIAAAAPAPPAATPASSMRQPSPTLEDPPPPPPPSQISPPAEDDQADDDTSKKAIAGRQTPRGRRRLFGSREPSVTASPLVIDRVNLISDDEGEAEMTDEQSPYFTDDSTSASTAPPRNAKRAKLRSLPAIQCLACNIGILPMTDWGFTGTDAETDFQGSLPRFCQLLLPVDRMLQQRQASSYRWLTWLVSPDVADGLLASSLASKPHVLPPPLNCYRSPEDKAFVAWLRCRNCDSTVGAVQLSPFDRASGLCVAYALAASKVC